MKYATLPYPIFQPFHPAYAKLIFFSLHFFSFQTVPFLSFTKK